MKISLLNEKIIIQKSKTNIDEIGNHSNAWSDFFICHTTISKESPSEVSSIGNIWDETKVDFTVRYSKEIEDINSTDFRIIFKGEVYDIKGIDHMNYKKKILKFHCKRKEK